jgi:hypothetical protein
MTSTPTPVSAATEQEHQHNDNQDHFHEKSPLTAMALFASYQAFNGGFKVLFPISAHPPTCIEGHEQIRSIPTQIQARPI